MGAGGILRRCGYRRSRRCHRPSIRSEDFNRYRTLSRCRQAPDDSIDRHTVAAVDGIPEPDSSLADHPDDFARRVYSPVFTAHHSDDRVACLQTHSIRQGQYGAAGRHGICRPLLQLDRRCSPPAPDPFLSDRTGDWILRTALPDHGPQIRGAGMSGVKKPFSKSAYVRKTEPLKAVHEYRHAPAHRGSEAQRLRVVGVEPDSLASRIGLAPGDEIIELNGKPLLDVIDFQFQAATIGRRTTLKTQSRTITFVRREWEPFGLEFESIEPMTCANQCVFCFVHQNPAKVRKSLHIKDEDYRLSFLFGNYLTLTNVDEVEMQRIIDQRLSPLYISVHATEPGLRARLLGIPEYDGFLEKVERLSAAGIMLHGQVVLCPNWNDGANLDRTIADMVKLHPGVA